MFYSTFPKTFFHLQISVSVKTLNTFWIPISERVLQTSCSSFQFFSVFPLPINHKIINILKKRWMCQSHLCVTLFSDILDLQTAYPSCSSMTLSSSFVYFSSFMIFYSVKIDTILITETEDLRYILTSCKLVWTYKTHLPLYSNVSV